MPSYELLFPGLYLKAADLQDREITVTIEALELEEIEGVEMVNGKAVDKKKHKGTIKFVGKDKRLVLGRTLGESLKLMFGNDYSKWIGKRIVLHTDHNVRFGKDIVDGIRIKGSPDIAGPMQAEIRRPRRVLRISVVKTTPPGPASPGTQEAAPQTSQPSSSPSSPSDSEAGADG